MSDIVEGNVVRRRVGAGSKSERDAVMIDTADGSFVLRRQGGNAFSDPQLDALVGRPRPPRGHRDGYDVRHRSMGTAGRGMTPSRRCPAVRFPFDHDR